MVFYAYIKMGSIEMKKGFIDEKVVEKIGG